jgi:phospholipid/cholesterol/gamma-HCH transport system substrate-binding protein
VIRTAIKFGAFVVVCLSITVFLAFTIGNISIRDPLGRNYYTLNATFDDVTGLLVNDNVKIAGVVVGKVQSIKVDQGRAKVTFTVKKDLVLGGDTTAAVRWRNLIGQRYVYLYPDSKNVTKLNNGDSIKSTTSVVDLGELLNRLGPIVAAIDPKQVNDFLDTVSQALDGNQDKVGKAIDDLATLAKGLGSRDEAIGRLVENLNTVAGTITNRDQQIRVMLDNLVLISSTFSNNTQTVDTALTEFGKFSTNLDTILKNNTTEFDGIIDNLDVLATQVVNPKLGELDSALKGIDTVAAKVFGSSRLGEWLNQSILCAATGPPSGGQSCATPIIKDNSSPVQTGTPGATTEAPATGQALPAPGTPPSSADIGSRAPSPVAGSNTLEQLLMGAAQK